MNTGLSIFLFMVIPIFGAFVAEIFYWQKNRKDFQSIENVKEFDYWISHRLDNFIAAICIGWVSAILIGSFDFNAWLINVTGIQGIELTNHGAVLVITVFSDLIFKKLFKKKTDKDA